jgi:cell division protein ZipA
MSELRWILLAVGLLIVAYAYWRGRREHQRRERATERRIEPVVGREPPAPEPIVGGRTEPRLGIVTPRVTEPARVPGPAANADTPPAHDEIEPAPANPAEQKGAPTAAPATKIVALRIARRDGTRIPGTMVLGALAAEGLEFGEHNIFHREVPAPGGGRHVLFSVANMVKPGELDPMRAGHEDFPGLTIFMMLPGPRPGGRLLSEMLSAARRIATALDADVLDDHGSTLSRQTADHLRDEVIEFEQRHGRETRATLEQ